MASASALAAAHRLHQLSIRAQTIRDAFALWATWEPGDAAGWRRMMALARPLVELRHSQSAHLARVYFDQAARDAGSDITATIAEPLPDEMIAASLAQTGLVGVIAAKSRGLSIEAAAQVGLVRFSGGLSRLALSGGRDTITQSAPQGWRRVTDGEPCDFCQQIADEGDVTGDFQAHDHCACSAEPLF